ncbi:Na(+)/H(+) antiporter ApNhaP [Halomicronema hongdechloris C2206]|uniref:Na(+)/H(+) antiporter ApNhaP n=2 Tax=Halomicronema hongdechloris TaxID=1209493 RepID=A0A1Z3HN32_9CYAN|nr:sodium:proton antiporter [Halomicronema hongdechloris]ASC71701.1 Na(+)/H(+) antiporter ApNhaP [Halomicronema hongdechloris C2206]
MSWLMVVESALEDPAIEANLRQFCLVLLVSLGVATLSRVLTLLRNIPYTLLLLLVGLGLAILDVRLVNLSPELILFIFLPPLLFEAAWNLNWQSLRRDFIPILLYAVVGVLISIGGLVLGLGTLAGASLATVLLVGASLSATDPVSVVALFRELGVDKRLTTLMEGESLFNDGVAVVAFNLLVGLALGVEQFDVSVTVARFLVFVGIGTGIGALIGFGISFLTQRFDLPLVEQSLTLVSAYGTYLVAEELGGSGVIAVVTTGLILGNFGSRIGMNPRTRLAVSEFWEFVAFFVNSIVFLLIGDQVKFEGLANNLNVIGIAIAIILITRLVSIFGLGALSNWLVQANIPRQGQTVLWWGGLRGSVSVALALSVPVSLSQREEIIAIVFGVMLFTLLVQGLTTQPLLEKLGLLGDEPLRQEYKQMVAHRVAMNRVMQRLRDLKQRQEMDPELLGYQMALVEGQLNEVNEKLTKLVRQNPEIQAFATQQLRDELLAIESDTYAEFIRAGQIKDELKPLLQEVLPDRLGEEH